MIFESASPRLMLAAGELVRLPAGACATIVCAQGAVWVTRDGEPQDVVLSCGDSLDLRDNALTLVQAFEPSLIQVREGPARCTAAAAAPTSARLGRAAAALVARVRASLGPPTAARVAAPAAPAPHRPAAVRLGPVDAGALITPVVSHPNTAWRSASGACQA